MRGAIVTSMREGIRQSIKGNGTPVPAVAFPLQTTLVPSMGLVNNPATFTRATTAITMDYLGRPLPVLAGEARFKGARRVRNLIVASEDMTNGAYAAQLGATIDSATEASFDGTAGGSVYQSITITDDGSGAGGRTFVYSAYIGRVSGTLTDVKIRMQGNAVTAGEVDITSSITDAPQRFSIAVSTDAAGTLLEPVVVCEDVATLYISKWQPEETTGNDDPTVPSEYVSTGVQTGGATELISNGTDWTGASGNTPPTGWSTASAVVQFSVSGGQLTIDRNGEATADDSDMRQAVTTVTGKDYVIRFDVVATDFDNITVGIDGVNTTQAWAAGSPAIIPFTATDASTDIDIRGSSSANQIITIDNFSVKEADHGANRDGVKYFNYKNATTVSSGVVTEARGASIGASDFYADADGPEGYWSEGARTNICLQSNAFTTTWVAANASPVANYAIAPDGSKTAWRLIDDAAASGNVNVRLREAITMSNADWTYSVYAKQDQLTFLQMSFGSVTNPAAAFFNLANGTIATTSGTLTTGIEALSNDWYRCWITADPGADFTGDLQLYACDADNDITADDDGTSSILVWGAQVEAGSFPSSYIPTTSSSVTRNADVLTYSAVGNADSFPMTVSLDYTPSGGITGGDILFQVDDGDASDRVQIAVDGSSYRARTLIQQASGTQASFNDATTPTAGTTYTIASVAAANDVEGYVDGVSYGTDVVAAMPTSLTTIRIGTENSSTEQPYSPIRNVKIYNKRLTDAQVAAL